MNETEKPGQEYSPERETAARPSRGGWSWLTRLFGGKAIDNRVEENFPSWGEYSGRKLDESAARKDPLASLPPHRVFISSPLHWNFVYSLVIVGVLALGYAQPDWAPFFVYGAIFVIFLTAMFVVIRDGIFFHLEGQRLERDCETINEHAGRPDLEKLERDSEQAFGLLRSLSRKSKSKRIFRSSLLQIHYQNIVRTFEQGGRRAWVSQEASIGDLHTLLSQRGMKMVWTFIEVLPQLGLLGTLIGLTRMFFAFNAGAQLPELSIIAGFGTALGTTILANLFVIILRPIYMQNERSMNEILNTLQMLMATFILPTQQSVLDRPGRGSAQGRAALFSSGLPPSPEHGTDEGRLGKTVEELTHVLEGFTKYHQEMDSGNISREAFQVAREVKETMESFKESLNPVQVNFQNQALLKLTDALQGLSKRLDAGGGDTGRRGAPSIEKIEHDLMQLRLLTHDTLILLDQIAGRLGAAGEGRLPLLSQNEQVRGRAFGVEEDPESLPDGPPRGTGSQRAGGRRRASPNIRLFPD